MSEPGKVLSVEDVSKRFGKVVALQNVSFSLNRGEVLGLAGDNGAGKSTLIKVINGALQPDGGTIRFDGDPVDFHNTRDAKRLGIQTTFQHLALAPNLTVAENIFLTREPVSGFGPFGVLRKRKMRKKTEELLDQLEIDVDTSAEVSNLSGGEQQLVAIARTMLTQPEVIIMDEPTSALSVEGADKVTALIKRMQKQGVSIILISHNLEWIQDIVDRLVILHHGHVAGDFDSEDVSRDMLVERMVRGRPTTA